MCDLNEQGNCILDYSKNVCYLLCSIIYYVLQTVLILFGVIYTKFTAVVSAGMA